MTREHKLALIVGFSLVLLVGVLISDHLSRARHAQVLAVGPDDPVPTEAGLRAPVDPLVAVGEAPPAAPAQPPSSDPSSIADASPSPQLPAHVPKSLDDAISQTAVQISQGKSEAVQADVQLVNNLAREGIRVESDLGGEPVVVKTPPIADPIAPKPAEDAIRWHTVKRGETLFQIATKYYGTGHKWKDIAAANKGKVGANGSAREGVRLKIPGAPSSAQVAAAPAGAGTKPPADPKPAPKRAATYTVKRGDTLGVIAQRTLGTSRRAQDLMEANGIDDEDHITVGMVLKIPGA